jgi:hypothetical protein
MCSTWNACGCPFGGTLPFPRVRQIRLPKPSLHRPRRPPHPPRWPKSHGQQGNHQHYDQPQVLNAKAARVDLLRRRLRAQRGVDSRFRGVSRILHRLPKTGELLLYLVPRRGQVTPPGGRKAPRPIDRLEMQNQVVVRVREISLQLAGNRADHLLVCAGRPTLA